MPSKECGEPSDSVIKILRATFMNYTPTRDTYGRYRKEERKTNEARPVKNTVSVERKSQAYAFHQDTILLMAVLKQRVD